MIVQHGLDAIDWAKVGGLLPVVVQHWRSAEVLMLGYMNPEALAESRKSAKATFYSRSRQRLWTKGESSGNFLHLKSLHLDCDGDTLLALAEPVGPTCHTGAASCFADVPVAPLNFLGELDALIGRRLVEKPAGSYTTRLFESGLRRIAQKLGEEGVETALAAVAQDDAELLGESADLIFHLLVLLHARGLDLAAVVRVLRDRHRDSAPE